MCTVTHTIAINSLYECRLRATGDAEMKEENATVRIMNRHMLSMTVEDRKRFHTAFLRFVYNPSFPLHKYHK